ncbi:DUF3800 domain-containing protein [Niallia sp. FSL W8-0177]|uniref:DUF3800 domain-containing protein n=1 Tax=Niallia TaxID=2837506 RepID=UPI002E1EDB80|nr:DUF3800 domain-containing protein [Niallia circulans]
MFNIYCDESCHLENDKQKSMVIGSIKVPRSLLKEVSEDIRDIKVKHGLSRYAEIKWTKVSPSKTSLYIDLINYFFDNPVLTFRAIIIKDKQQLDHSAFDQSHDDWYYKMYYFMLRPIVDTNDIHVYLDIKDTNSAHKVVNLREYLCNYLHDFDREKITKMQLIRSEESQVLQLADLLMGAVSYENRGLSKSDAKLAIINRIKKLTGHSLVTTTVLSERKFNLFTWEPQQRL